MYQCYIKIFTNISLLATFNLPQLIAISFLFHFVIFHWEFKYTIKHLCVYSKLPTLCHAFVFLVHLSLAIKELLTVLNQPLETLSF